MYAKAYNLFAIFCTLGVACVDSARILGLFHFPVKSQHVLGSFLLKELAARGHEVTMVSPFKLEKPVANYTDVVIEHGLEAYMTNSFTKKFKGQTQMNVLQKLQATPNLFLDFQRLYLDSPELKEFLNSGAKFDLVIQLYNMNEAMFGIGHHFNAPTIAFCSVGASFLSNNLFANPAPYAMVPTAFTSSVDGFFDRLLNVITGFGFEMVQQFKSLPIQAELLKKHFPNAPPLQELMDGVRIALMNSHPAVEGSKPYMPNMIQIGGFYMQEPEVLPQDLQKFLDSAKQDGAILFSFGTAVKPAVFPPEQLQMLLRVFGRLKQKVLFKWDEQLEEIPRNVLARGWIPQTGILAHKNVRLFVTHAGLGGVAECIYYAVPAVCIPFFGDQHKNCDDMVQNGYAKKLDIDQLTEDLLYETIQSVLIDSKYKEKITSASEFYRSQPVSPLETAIFWIEHVLKHGGSAHFPKNIGTKQKLYEYLLLDIAVFFLIIILFSFVIIRALVKIVCLMFCNKKNVSKEQPQRKNKKKIN